MQEETPESALLEESAEYLADEAVEVEDDALVDSTLEGFGTEGEAEDSAPEGLASAEASPDMLTGPASPNGDGELTEGVEVMLEAEGTAAEEQPAEPLSSEALKVELAKFLAGVAEHFSTTVTAMHERKGRSESVHARWVAAQALRKAGAPNSLITATLNRPSDAATSQLLQRKCPPLDQDVETFAAQLESLAFPAVRKPRRKPRTRRSSAAKPERKPEPCALPIDEIDRLVLTASNFFGLSSAEVCDNRIKQPDPVAARAILYVLLEDEFTVKRKHIAEYFGRTTTTLNGIMTNEKTRELVLRHHDDTQEILAAFRAGDTLDEQAAEIRRERNERLAALRKQQEREKAGIVRDVPPEELELFERFFADDDEAVTTIDRLYLKPVTQTMRKQLKGSGVSLPESLPEESLHRTARYFLPVAEKHESFESWAILVAEREAAKLIEGHKSAERLENLDPVEFGRETYEVFHGVGRRRFNGKSVQLPSAEANRILGMAKETYTELSNERGRLPLQYKEFDLLLNRLYKATVRLREPNKLKDAVPEDSVTRQFDFTDFSDEDLRPMLRTMLELAVRDAEAAATE